LESDLSNFLNKYNYDIEDFQKGIAKRKDINQSIKIGKVLTKIGKQDKEAISLLNKFNTSLQRVNIKTISDVYIVFSKHPYDVLGATTDRDWTSCMSLHKSQGKKYIKHDIKEGTFIVYAIKGDDPLFDDGLAS